MQYKWVKLFLRACFKLNLGKIFLGLLIPFSLCILSSLFLSRAGAVMTITSVNGIPPINPAPSPTPYVSGLQAFYYYVTGTAIGTGAAPTSWANPSLLPSFLPAGFTPLNILSGSGYAFGTAYTYTDTSPLANAVGVNISFTTALQQGSINVVTIQTSSATPRYIPIAGIAGANGSNPAPCGSQNCYAFNINNSIQVVAGTTANAPYYAAAINGNNFTVYFYPQDICGDDTATVLAPACVNRVIANPTTNGNGSVTFNLKFLIQTIPGPVPTPTATPTGSIDSTTNAVSFSFQNSAPTFNCPSLSAVTIKPDDSRIYIDASQFLLTGVGLAPGQNFITVAKLGAAPVYNSTFMNPGVNSLFSPGVYGSALYVAQGTGFLNSTDTVNNPYYLAFLIQDKTGIYTPPSPVPSQAPFPPTTPAAQSCTAFGPMETSAVNGFLPGGKHCFIATAAFGSSEAHPVQLLRDFRDEFLLPFTLGRSFVHWYYDWSPSAADWLLQHPLFRLPVLLLLFQLEVIAWGCLHPGLIFSILGFGIVALSSILFRTRRRRVSEKVK